MLRLQWRLFFQSGLRVAILILLFGGSLYYYFPALASLVKGEPYYASLGMLYQQLGGCIYVFILTLLLSYDFYCEIPDASLLETLKASGSQLKHDCIQALILLTIVLLYGGIFVFIHVLCHVSDGTFAPQVFVYYLRIAGIYYVLNGAVAILLSWLLSRTVGKVLGYICVILFSCMVSPMVTQQLQFYVLWARGIFDWFRVFILMPEGVSSFNEFTGYAANLSIASRGLFWIGALIVGLTFCYSSGKRHFNRWIITMAGTACASWAVIYCNLPASYYCASESLDTRDSVSYDQWRYMIDESEQQERKAEFQISACDMELTLRRQLKAKVTIVPDKQDLETYDMTLYHLYEIDKITDENGKELEYQRDENSLTVYGDEDGTEAICMVYHGGSPTFYSNWDAMYLPGWFPYYPIPGFHPIYKDYEYVNNTLEYEAKFDIEIDTGGIVYSDLERVEENHFSGMSSGPTLLSGFVKEQELESGIRCIYPYLYVDSTPNNTFTKDDQEFVLSRLQEEYSDVNIIMMTPLIPTCGAYIYDDEKIVDSANFRGLRNQYERTGYFSRAYEAVEEQSEEEAIQIFQNLYWDMKGEQSQEGFYDAIMVVYQNSMGGFGYTEEQFEEFMIKYLGQDEWDYVKESRTYVED